MSSSFSDEERVAEALEGAVEEVEEEEGMGD